MLNFDFNDQYKGVLILVSLSSWKVEFSENLSWKFCSQRFWNGCVTDIKTPIFWLSDLILFVQVLFGLNLQKYFNLLIDSCYTFTLLWICWIFSVEYSTGERLTKKFLPDGPLTCNEITWNKDFKKAYWFSIIFPSRKSACT